LKDIPSRAGFYDLPSIHNGQAIRQISNYAQIVRDKHNGHVELLFDRSKQFDDLGLDSNIQRGGRFIGDEELWTGCQGHCNHDALLHAAGHFVGITANTAFGGRDSNALQQTDHLCIRRSFGTMEL
jgi:hypothetical protein